MVARLLVPLCLCCVLLCVFVGVLSQRAIEEAEQVSSEIVDLDCGSLIDKRPKVSTGVLISDFILVDEVAAVDFDGDGAWDEIAVPLFSRESFKSKVAYRAVIACFRDVPDLKTLKQRLASNELKANYRVNDQELASVLHAQLAKELKSLDFKNSPVVTVGYGESNPVLGAKTLQICYRLGAVAIGVGVLSLFYTILTGLMENFKLPHIISPSKGAQKKKTF